ncbi:related to FMO1 - flavin-containing monooxygenase [Melanopsichium pennsylvanicum]|uniref:Related to FMO1 - flavin-containing monooxygenase n=2 Tax=Melanopsichium pennsylvanicum TaxID=63383 RepID=A0AAJ4XJP5_9BASI|nr:conserved hypothetical protein [Melanopsichium pennsylvanicum 4]SNX83358.1 related to FMO1 - flavin-containing monooxygenase [Melanopsichium pennsylvanicum]
MTGTRIIPRTREQGPETVLIIGGGATGLVTLRNLAQELGHDSSGSYPLFAPTLVERRQEVGGVWYWSDETYFLERTVGPQNTQGLSPIFDLKGQPHWPSPAYLNLRGNVLPEFLEFSGKVFDPPAHNQTFPTLKETHNYLLSFAQPFRKYIKCKVEVLKAVELAHDSGWEVTWKDWGHSAINTNGAVSFTPIVETRKFDRIVVAAGWYDTPYYPQVDGIDQAKQAGHIHHCKHYRDSSAYRRKKVVVVGNNNSANEVAAHLAPLNSVTHPVYRSSKSAPVDKCPSLPDERIKDVGMIIRYNLVHTTTTTANTANTYYTTSDTSGVGENKKITTKLDLTLVDGSVIKDVDYVILGTGYGQKYPWLYVLTDSARSCLPGDNFNSHQVEPLTPDSLKGTRVPYMYNHALFSKSPRLTLAFVGLVISLMPFSFNDLISAWITAVWAGKITSIPISISDRLKFETRRLEYLYTQKCLSSNSGTQPDPNDDAMTYSGYHLLGGSLKQGPPSEFHFASQLFEELQKVDEKSVKKWRWKWDQEREDRQNSMYKIKKSWLEKNKLRIRNDPFDLLGSNSHTYGHLKNELVLQNSTNTTENKTATTSKL